jgi:hypothetical protein
MFVAGAVAIVVSIYSSQMVAILGTFGWGTLVSGTFRCSLWAFMGALQRKGSNVRILVSFVFNLITVFGFKYPSTLPAISSPPRGRGGYGIRLAADRPQELSPRLDAVMKL